LAADASGRVDVACAGKIAPEGTIFALRRIGPVDADENMIVGKTSECVLRS